MDVKQFIENTTLKKSILHLCLTICTAARMSMYTEMAFTVKDQLLGHRKITKLDVWDQLTIITGREAY